MKAKVFLHALGIWFVFALFAILNGTIRNIFLEPYLGQYPAHIIAAATMGIFILTITYLFVTHIKIPFSKFDFLLIGLLWVMAGVAFEFVFGHYVMGNSWEVLLADYNILAGRLWILILACELFGPLIFSMAQKKKANSTTSRI